MQHLKIFYKILVMLCMLFSVAACNIDEPAPAPEPIPQPNPGEVVERTVLVYIVARNSLGAWDFDLDDIQEMSQAAKSGAFGKNRLILFHSRYGEAPSLKEVTAGGVKQLKSYDMEFSAIEARNMTRVIADVKAAAPASNYGIVLWSHADGWLQSGIPDTGIQKRAFGDDNRRSMNVTTLARVLDGEDFDFVYFDCCFMGGVEVAYQLRGVTPRIVASPSELPSPGMPYDKTLPYLMADEADVEGAARATFAYYDALGGSSRTCTMSVIDTSHLADLAGKVRALYRLHPALNDIDAIQQYAGRRSSFHGYYFDLGHYMSNLDAGNEGCGLAYAEAVDALDRCLIYRAATPYLWQYDREEVKIDHYSGLSTYVLQNPPVSSDKGYEELEWYKDVAKALF